MCSKCGAALPIWISDGNCGTGRSRFRPFRREAGFAFCADSVFFMFRLRRERSPGRAERGCCVTEGVFSARRCAGTCRAHRAYRNFSGTGRTNQACRPSAAEMSAGRQGRVFFLKRGFPRDSGKGRSPARRTRKRQPDGNGLRLRPFSARPSRGRTAETRKPRGRGRHGPFFRRAGRRKREAPGALQNGAKAILHGAETGALLRRGRRIVKFRLTAFWSSARSG